MGALVAHAITKPHLNMAAPQPTNTHVDGSLSGHPSLWHLLSSHVPPDKLGEVKRVLYGSNQGLEVQELKLDENVVSAAALGDFDLQTASFSAAKEQLRGPRVVRIGLVQHQIVKPTTAPYAEQAKVRDLRSRPLVNDVA